MEAKDAEIDSQHGQLQTLTVSIASWRKDLLVCQLRLIYGLMVIGGERKAADRGGGWTGPCSRERC